MFSRFFIDRPLFAAVISTFIVLAGLAAMRNLPIAQYPEIAPPVVTVQAVYPGASAETLEQTVAAEAPGYTACTVTTGGAIRSWKSGPSTGRGLACSPDLIRWQTLALS